MVTAPSVAAPAFPLAAVARIGARWEDVPSSPHRPILATLERLRHSQVLRYFAEVETM